MLAGREVGPFESELEWKGTIGTRKAPHKLWTRIGQEQIHHQIYVWLTKWSLHIKMTIKIIEGTVIKKKLLKSICFKISVLSVRKKGCQILWPFLWLIDKVDINAIKEE